MFGGIGRVKKAILILTDSMKSGIEDAQSKSDGLVFLENAPVDRPDSGSEDSEGDCYK